MNHNHLNFVFLSRQGRITRKTYWLYSLPLALMFMISEFYISADSPFLLPLLAVIILYPAMMINIKRCHDLDKTGYFSLLLFVPVVNLWPLFELSFCQGSADTNRFGNEENLWEQSTD